MILFRILAILALLFSVLFLPFIVSLVLGMVLALRFRYFVELPIVFLLADTIYAVPEARFLGVTLISFFLGAGIVGIIELLRTRIRFFNHDAKSF